VSTVFLFPGQGEQRAGMLRALDSSAPAVTRVFETARAELAHSAYPLDDLDSAETLASTTGTQLALLIAAVASANVLVQDHGIAPEYVAGHSVGAFAAATTCGVLTLPEAIHVVIARGEAMQATAAGGDWGMSAVLGLDHRAVGQLVDELTTHDARLWIANINGESQIVVSGAAAALERLCTAAAAAGARNVTRLNVAVASHCPLQAATSTLVRRTLEDVPIRPQTAAYMTNTGGRRIRDDAAKVIADLAASASRPVRWYDAMRVLGELGVTTGVQMPPGHELVPMLTAAAPAAYAFAMEDVPLTTATDRLRPPAPRR
jgi:malonate decarboxylase epsilon subunit